RAPAGASLAVTGNKTIAVEFGSSQDAALRQSLDLALSGRIAPDVTLTGTLSDRNLPLTAQGGTQDVQALDQVLVELKAPQGGASLGDVPLALERGEFARLERRVQGVSGQWAPGAFQGFLAAASAQGEYQRLQLLGVDGEQGPYQLTDRGGNAGITVVAGSEIVWLDGERMTRGEGADYVLDYERARLTFTNRRPITSASRITVEYQFALTRYRRNLAAFAGDWHQGALSLYTTAMTESDDRGRPLDQVLDANDLRTLVLAGDSLALGAGVTPGVGDYDTVRVAPDTLIFAYAGTDSGQFAVAFARVGDGRGDYADSAIVSGRTIYRRVGPGRGAFRVGRLLPSPQSHQLLTLGGSVRQGPLTVDAEGAASKLDLNTFSPLDDRGDAGGAGRARVALEGRAPGLPGSAGVSVAARSVEAHFSPFSQLERPFAEEDWGLPLGADLDHQRRADAAAWWRPRAGSELRAQLSRLTTPDGYAGAMRRLDGQGGLGALAAQLTLLDAGGDLAGRTFGHGGRRRAVGGLRWGGRLLAPSLHVDLDRRETPADSARTLDRARELAADLASGSAVAWRLATGATWRRDDHDAGALAGGSRSLALRAG
ncbi:MAG TPA: hypothetical protein VGU27_09825, partial [Candidatus Eisenbacteria bacterium]|nr:hypothetical protein [Candidatus Eisenbacteria bacterium]